MSIQGEGLVEVDSNQFQYNEEISQLNSKISKLTENYESIRDINIALRDKNEVLSEKITKLTNENSYLKELLIEEEGSDKSK